MIKNYNKTEQLLSCIIGQLDEVYKEIRKDKKYYGDKRFQFIEKYNRKLFLEENEKNYIRLRDVYIDPRYKENEVCKSNSIGCLEEFMFDDKDNNILFIVGQSAIGKSSLLCNLVDKYQFRNDIIALQSRELEDEKDLIIALKRKLSYTDSDFANKILILDGLDESKTIKNSNNVKEVLREFICDLQNLLPKENSIKAIITIRKEYFRFSHWRDSFENTRVIELLGFDGKQIIQFKEKYFNKKNNSDVLPKFLKSELPKKNLGIISNPMMLYMICHYEETVGGNLSKCSIYEKIFGINGSLFANLYKGKGYHENEEDIKYVCNVIQNIGYRMFAHNTYFVSTQDDEEYKKITNSRFIRYTGMLNINSDINDICKLEFVHNSISSYFAAEYIYNQLYSIFTCEDYKEQRILKTIDEVFSARNIEGEVLDFLIFFIENRDIIYKEQETQYLKKSISYILSQNCISSLENKKTLLIDRIHNAFNGYWKVVTILYQRICKENKTRFLLSDFLTNPNDSIYLARLLKNGTFNKLYLQGVNLNGTDMRCAVIKDADLRYSSLNNVDFRGASLVGSKICYSELENANLNGADLCKVQFNGTSLKRTKMRGSVLKECKFKGAKNIYQVKFSYSNIMFINDIDDSDLQNCYVYNKDGKLKKYFEIIEEEQNFEIL
ncbi:MAG: pentapeptide repeat-containing protein [Erysipelotrichales bacterium]|nr:pentapeptide repeat-containing protein [Erysipelotrichales bacterium]